MGLLGKIGGSVLQTGLGIGASLIGAKGQAKEDARARQFEAEQAALGRGEQAREFDVTAGMTKQQFEAQQAQQAAQRQAYNQMLGRAGEGEQQFMAQSNIADPTIEAQKQELLSGQSKALQAGTGELRANLAMQGVRGGQAGTQMRRGIGEMTEAGISDINKIGTEDALRRAAERRAYLSVKGQTGGAGQVAFA